MKNQPKQNPICLLRSALAQFDECKRTYAWFEPRVPLNQPYAVAHAPRHRVALIRACEDLRVLTYGVVNAELRTVEIAALRAHHEWAQAVAEAHVAPLPAGEDAFYNAITATEHGCKLMAQSASTDLALTEVQSSWDGMISPEDLEVMAEVVQAEKPAPNPAPELAEGWVLEEGSAERKVLDLITGQSDTLSVQKEAHGWRGEFYSPTFDTEITDEDGVEGWCVGDPVEIETVAEATTREEACAAADAWLAGWQAGGKGAEQTG